jgi:nucleoid-associated protein YgaU
MNKAVLHYRLYLDRVPAGTQKNAVGDWLERAEKTLYEELRAKYGAPVSPLPPVATPPPTVTQTPPVADVQPPPPPTTTIAAAPKTRFYEVRSGDNLARIAKRELGSEKYWEQIWELNKDNLASPERLQIGQRLLLPDVK